MEIPCGVVYKYESWEWESLDTDVFVSSIYNHMFVCGIHFSSFCGIFSLWHGSISFFLKKKSKRIWQTSGWDELKSRGGIGRHCYLMICTICVYTHIGIRYYTSATSVMIFLWPLRDPGPPSATYLFYISLWSEKGILCYLFSSRYL